MWAAADTATIAIRCVETQEELETEKCTGEWAKKSIVAVPGAAESQECRKQQGLRNHFGVRIAPEPYFDRVAREQEGRRRGWNGADEPRPGEVDREHPDIPPQPQRPGAPRSGR